MSHDIGRFNSSDTETPAETPSEEQKPAELVYGSAEEFLHEQLLPTYFRDVDGRAAKWCIEWYYHPEAVTRVEALWRAWEHLRLDGGTGISVWFKDHADHHMSVLLDPRISAERPARTRSQGVRPPIKDSIMPSSSAATTMACTQATTSSTGQSRSSTLAPTTPSPIAWRIVSAGFR